MSLFTQTIMSAEPVSSYDALVILMGIGMVFVGLICLIVICYLLGAVLKRFKGKEEAKPAVAVAKAPAASNVSAPIENKQELIAAISCVIAEELGTSVSAIRIKSIKKV